MPQTADGSTVSSIRTNPSAAIGSPERLLISHQYVKPKGSVVVGVDRHVVRFDFTKAASGDVPEVTSSVYMNIVVPRVGVTAAEVKDQVGLLVDLVNDLTLLTRLLNSDPIAE
jgi:hypothetical protein